MRRLAGWALALAVLAALVVLGISKIDLGQVGRALAHVRLGWVAVAFLLMAGTLFSRAQSWHVAIGAALGRGTVGRLTVTRVMFIGMFGSTVAPGRLGEAVRAWLIAQRAGGARQTLATVVGTLISQSFLNLLALLILAAVALAGGAIPGASTSAVVLLTAVPPAILIVLMLGPKLASTFAGVERGPVGRLLGWVARQLGEVSRGLAVFRRLRTIARSAGFQLSGWAMQTGTCYAVILAFGLEHRAGLPTAAAVLFAVNVTAVVPLTPSNVGVFQAACIAVLAPLGIRAGTALAYGLVLQAVEIVCSTALGLPSLLAEGLSLSDLRRHGSLLEAAHELQGEEAA